MASGTIKKPIKFQLWVNPSPAASFAAQTVSVDLSIYDFYTVRCMQSTGNQRTTGFFFCPVDEVVNNYQAVNNSGVISSRQFSYSISDKEISFGNARNNGSQDNGFCIPYDIWGIKL